MAEAYSEKKVVPVVGDDEKLGLDGVISGEMQAAGLNRHDSGEDSDNIVIRTGADAAVHLLPMRDDFDSALTVRSMVLASGLAAFQAVMSQIYTFKPTAVTISGTFIVLIGYFVGNAWAKFIPRGDHQLALWREKKGLPPTAAVVRTGDFHEHAADADADAVGQIATTAAAEEKPPLWIRALVLLNPGPWSLKEHAVCSITATSASNASASVMVFSAQKLFYSMDVSAVTVILSTISIGLFGYGLCGVLRPITVWHVESVYWSTLPTVKTLQGLHWQDVKNSRPLRVFWYGFLGMTAYEFFPAYIWPWLNSVSIPCLAAMHTHGSRADIVTNLFGGSINNEGLGLLNFSFDWQYITSFNTSLPLSLQLHSLAGYIVCYAVMLAIYYSNAWNSRIQPFMSTRLRTVLGGSYPVSKVFVNGVLDETALAKYGVPRLAGSFAYAMFMANAAIGALVAHCFLFWGGDVKRAFASARAGRYDDPHHTHMTKHYRETPWYWYIAVLVISFVLGIVVVVHEDISLPVWAYIVSLLLGCFIAPLSTLLYARYGNGIATNNLSKMIAGLAIPGRPVGNMYFAAWSHNVIVNTVNLSNDLKLGEYLKIPPRTMFLTQIYGTVLGGFINYAVMISIVNGHRDLLVNSNGSSSWSGATIQSYNTNAASWAMAKYLYKTGAPYAMVPIGLAIGAGVVVLHRVVVRFVPKIRGLDLRDINMPQFIQFAGFIPYNASQTCVIWSQLIAGFFVQLYLRRYKPAIFKNYVYLVTGAFDGAALFVLFILSFAVFGAGGPSKPFPTWWGNNANGYYDLCPSSS
ncbi:opt peptide transporter [Grosmannia clavigera kw1407]|uniref:Opt peptide transporter n=1 Tax=Grosmannia clavigera (strain kw1407 / UAMH 11150) TaxID=655863 RepID=F0X6W3_GROCL|nr:opt peptide transporter [Grosmannia clavigera kw1407]EFX06458.1 opt peptide transporter [Grosmannia clavigera kw1407]